MLGSIVLLVVAQGLVGCGGSDSSMPPAPSTIAPAPTPAALDVWAISPNTGSTGGTPVIITGTGFQSGAIVTLGDTAIKLHAYVTSTTMSGEAPAHAAGQVDVVVLNPDGQAHRLVGGYTYALPESFNFNGSWGGVPHETPIRFTIQNNTLASVSCGTSETFTFSPPPSVSNGEFSFRRDDGIAVSGRILSASAAMGTINLAPCTTTTWYAERQR
jgi:hypothetical protein